VADHADRSRAAREDLGRDSLELGALAEEAQQSLRLLSDLGEEARARLARGRLRVGGFS
jgi:hypothetical protein